MRAAHWSREPVRKRFGRVIGTLGVRVSVYDDIKQLIQDEASEIEQAKQAAKADHDAAISAADAAYDRALSPLLVRADALQTLKGQVETLQAQAEAGPTVPSAPESGADGTSDSSGSTPPEAPSSSAESSPTDESSSSPSTPTTPDASPSPESAPAEQATPSAADPIPLADVPAAISSGADTATPVSVPTTTGEVAVVTVADVIEASDRTVPTEALSQPAQTVRQSDLPW